MHQPYLDPFWWQMNQREKSGFYELAICLWFYDLLISYEWRKPRKHLGFLPRNLFKIIFSILAVKLQFPGISNVWIFIATTWQTYHSARFRWILILVICMIHMMHSIQGSSQKRKIAINAKKTKILAKLLNGNHETKFTCTAIDEVVPPGPLGKPNPNHPPECLCR